MTTTIRRYSRGRKLISVREATGINRHYHFDHQGTTQCMTDDNGSITDRFASDAWGVPVKRPDSAVNRHWYIGNGGYYSVSEGSRPYIRARWYEARIGTWLSNEPIPALRQRARGSTYAYVSNLPTNRTDPRGLDWEAGTPQPNYPWVTEPPINYNIRQPTFFEMQYCPWAGFIVYGHLCGVDLFKCPTLTAFNSHWEEHSGSTWIISDAIQRKLYVQGTHDLGCGRLVKDAASFAEQLLQTCPKENPGPVVAAARHPIFYRKTGKRGEGAYGGGANAGDVDLFNAIGSSDYYFTADVWCRCINGKDVFYLTYKRWITDQYIGADEGKKDAYACHLNGIMRDFVMKSAWGNSGSPISWERGKFSASHDSKKVCLESGHGPEKP